MPISCDYSTPTFLDQTKDLMRYLNLATHRHGYTYLCEAIPSYAQDRAQRICKEIYADIAKAQGFSDWHVIESAIRDVIMDAWEKRNPDRWDEFFPSAVKAPSNKVFIAALADRLK